MWGRQRERGSFPPDILLCWNGTHLFSYSLISCTQTQAVSQRKAGQSEEDYVTCWMLVTGCLSSIREGTQLSKNDVLRRFQHSSVFQALPLCYILLQTSGHLPHLARLQLQENTQPPLFSHLGPSKGKERKFFFFALSTFLLSPLFYFPFSKNPQTTFAFQSFGFFPY